MTRRGTATLLALAAALGAAGRPTRARATGFTDLGEDILAHGESTVAVHGALRLDGELLHNLDLDRGVTPSGQPLFPVPLDSPEGQALTHAAMRLRLEAAAYSPGHSVAVKLRLGVLEGLALGSLPIGPPTATTAQDSPAAAVRVERAYGEVLLPVGLFAAGRMGSHFGLGMLAHGGDGFSDGRGDSADRIAWLVPTLGHVFAIAYDFSAVGPRTARRAEPGAVDWTPGDDVRSVTLAVLSFHDETSRARRASAGRATGEYGLSGAYRWQGRDVPESYVPVAAPRGPAPTSVVPRDYDAAVLDAWARLELPWLRVEAEAALVLARIGQASLLPGVELREPVRSSQWGAVLESTVGGRHARHTVGLDLGVASGDPAPGFGVVAGPTSAPPRPGDLDGPQASPPGDTRVDNFRFHPNYRVDRILFRQLVGTVTDAAYVRPRGQATLWRTARASLEADLAVVASWALEPASTPGGAAALGVELDPALRYVDRDGFRVALEYAALFPLAGLENPELGLAARPAQLLHAELGFVF